MSPIKCLSFTKKDFDRAIKIVAIEEKQYPVWLKKSSDKIRNWVEQNGFSGKNGASIAIPGTDGSIKEIIAIYKNNEEFKLFSSLSERLPSERYYCISSPLNKDFATNASLGWAMGGYRFNRYLAVSKNAPVLCFPENGDKKHVLRFAEAVYLVRDLTNTPTNDLGTKELAHEALSLAKDIGASAKEIIGKDLLKNNYPTIYTVGQASTNEPRLVDIHFGNPKHPKITIIGKGVVFDSGGLDIKPSSGMILMKKDMGGAAHALAILKMIADAKLPIFLRILLPIVENSISSNAYRPGDVIKTRSGKTVEVGNTDAEGRLIMADAISEAITDKPEILIDIATLTGAARIAVGHEMGALFSNNKKLLNDLMASSDKTGDRLWPLPLNHDYMSSMSSKIADIDNSGSSGYAGATTAALFLESFLGENAPKWVHIDTPGWNKSSTPGHPSMGDAFGVWAIFDYLEKSFKRN